MEQYVHSVWHAPKVLKKFSHIQKMFPKPRFSGALELRGEGGRGSRGGGEGVKRGGVPPPLPE